MNSGYEGWKWSKRAQHARNEGKYPKTVFIREYGITATHFPYLDRNRIIHSYEWHHTSKECNRTPFYEWVEPAYEARYHAVKKQLAKLVRGYRKLKEPTLEQRKEFDKAICDLFDP